MKTYKSSMFGGAYKIRKVAPSRVHVKHEVEYIVNPNIYHTHYDAKPAPDITVHVIDARTIPSLTGHTADVPVKPVPHGMVGVSIPLTSIKNRPLPKMCSNEPLVITEHCPTPNNNLYTAISSAMALSPVTSAIDTSPHGNARTYARLQGHAPIKSRHTNVTPRTGTRSH